jgi:lipopolysaccharide exporter
VSLKSSAFSGVRWTTASSLSRAGLQFIQVLVLARLLTPHDFGLVAIVMAIMSFLQIFADMGVSYAIIYHRDITQEQLSSLYWLNVGASLFLAIMVAATSPLVASFYDQAEIQPLIILAALILLINSTGQQIRVLAEKELRFATLAKLEITGSVLGMIAAVIIALLNGGAFALLGGTAISAITVTTLMWIYLADGWKPTLVFHFQEIRIFLRFGAFMISNSLVNTFNSQIDVLLGGRILGVQPIGFFSLPRDLCLRIAGVINPITTRVGVPIIARSQDTLETLNRVYLSTIRMTASVNFPLYIILLLFPTEIVSLLFGSQWIESTPILSVLAAWGLVRSLVNSPIGMLLMGVGRPDLNFRWNFIMLLIFPPALWVGSHYGAIGLAFALLITTILTGVTPVWYFIARPICATGFLEYHKQIFIPLIITLAAGSIARLSVIPFNTSLTRLLIGIFAGGVFYLILSRNFNRIWFDAMTNLLISRKA